MVNKKVVIYTTPTCVVCVTVKAFFDKYKIKYKTIDVLKSLEERKKMIDLSGQMGVPVITIGKDFFVGFDYQTRNNIIELLEIKLNQ
ncbi:MAG: glutaredoxin family protein [Candidatus Paceibacterota bacterium]|jgi:glutaredoxin